MIRDLIYDVGMHEGEDTKFYIERGFKVVGVEANPQLVARIRETFARPIAEGKLQIVDKAIASNQGKVQLAVNRFWSGLSSIDPVVVACQSQWSDFDYVEVDAVPLDEVIMKFGMPYYLKIDIEGMDLLCLKALHHFSDRPKYISLETVATQGKAKYDQAFAELAELWMLGYRSFKYIDQPALSKLNGRVLDKEGPPQIYEHRLGSGPFGEDTLGSWLSIEHAHRRMTHLIRYHNTIGGGSKYSEYMFMRLFKRMRRIVKGLPSYHYHSWYDLHARLGNDV